MIGSPTSDNAQWRSAIASSTRSGKTPSHPANCFRSLYREDLASLLRAGSPPCRRRRPSHRRSSSATSVRSDWSGVACRTGSDSRRPERASLPCRTRCSARRTCACSTLRSLGDAFCSIDTAWPHCGIPRPRSPASGEWNEAREWSSLSLWGRFPNLPRPRRDLASSICAPRALFPLLLYRSEEIHATNRSFSHTFSLRRTFMGTNSRRLFIRSGQMQPTETGAAACSIAPQLLLNCECSSEEFPRSRQWRDNSGSTIAVKKNLVDWAMSKVVTS